MSECSVCGLLHGTCATECTCGGCIERLRQKLEAMRSALSGVLGYHDGKGYASSDEQLAWMMARDAVRS